MLRSDVARCGSPTLRPATTVWPSATRWEPNRDRLQPLGASCASDSTQQSKFPDVAVPGQYAASRQRSAHPQTEIQISHAATPGPEMAEAELPQTRAHRHLSHCGVQAPDLIWKAWWVAFSGAWRDLGCWRMGMDKVSAMACRQ